MVTKQFLFTLLAFSLTQTLPSAIASTSLTLNDSSKNFKLKSPDEFTSVQGRLICGLDVSKCGKPLTLERTTTNIGRTRQLEHDLQKLYTNNSIFIEDLYCFSTDIICDNCEAMCDSNIDKTYTFRCSAKNHHDICLECLREFISHQKHINKNKILVTNKSHNKAIGNKIGIYSYESINSNDILKPMTPNTIRSINTHSQFTFPQNNFKNQPPMNPQIQQYNTKQPRQLFQIPNNLKVQPPMNPQVQQPIVLQKNTQKKEPRTITKKTCNKTKVICISITSGILCLLTIASYYGTVTASLKSDL